MRYLAAAIFALSLSACAQIPPREVPPASQAQNQAIIFDIDGTLTPKNMSVFTAREGAAAAVNAYAAKGFQIVYLTARTPLLQSRLPQWLKEHGFPEGNLHVAQTSEERDEVCAFKAGILRRYVERGWQLAYAYGDSSTDFCAYAGAGIPPKRVFALKRQGDQECQSGVYTQCLEGWVEHLAFIEKESSAR
jgi:phosphatidate phosphatase PAH1